MALGILHQPADRHPRHGCIAVGTARTRREKKPINIPGAIAATSALALLTYSLSVSDPRSLLSRA